MNQPIKTEINNGIIIAKSAMPLKDLTSNNEAEFSMSRRLFSKSFFTNSTSTINKNGTTTVQRESLGLSTKAIIDGSKSIPQKKWIGGNRDASSVISRRKIENTGTILTNSVSSSFTNIIDNNTAREARIRSRSSGYRVPLSVTQKNVIPPVPYTLPIPIAYYRIVSTGLGYTFITNIQSSVYNYNLLDLSGTPIMSVGTGNAGRSYNLFTISRSTGKITIYPVYDVFGFLSPASALAAQLNALTNSVIVVIFTYDEPQTNSNLLVSAFQRCGASTNFNTMINYRGAYVLVGIPGIGVNNGLEKYVGNTTSTGDPNAIVDLRISVLDGQYRYISG